MPSQRSIRAFLKQRTRLFLNVLFFVGVFVAVSTFQARNYVDRHEINLPVMLGDTQIAQDWRVYAFPTYYVLDSDRRIRRRDLGYSTQFGLWWRTWFVD
ncbi:MAG: hypothetical protein WBM87_07910 [Woeseiaceae bacterium]